MHIRHFCGNEVILVMVLITYDVSTEDAAGRKRLRKIAKECLNYGQRVQNSVFECSLDNAQLMVVRDKLRKAMDEKSDSLRIYNLGNQYTNRIEHYGVKASYDPNDTMIF